MTRFSLFLILCALTGLAGCENAEGDLKSAIQPQQTKTSAPERDDDGTCWITLTTPAVIESVTHQKQVKSAKQNKEGGDPTPAEFTTVTEQKIVQERQESRVEVPCDDALTPEFVASVQRALAARGLYSGAVTGKMDAATRGAIGVFQQDLGIMTDTLTIDGARKLGLIAVEQEG